MAIQHHAGSRRGLEQTSLFHSPLNFTYMEVDRTRSDVRKSQRPLAGRSKSRSLRKRARRLARASNARRRSHDSAEKASVTPVIFLAYAVRQMRRSLRRPLCWRPESIDLTILCGARRHGSGLGNGVRPAVPVVYPSCGLAGARRFRFTPGPDLNSASARRRTGISQHGVA